MRDMKKQGWICYGAAFLFLAALSACGLGRHGAASAGGEPAKGEKTMLTITKADNGKAFAANVGETILVTLPENPTTGYRWELSGQAAPVLALAKDDYLGAGQGKKPAMLGSGGTREFTFKAAAPGAAKLALILRRSWESPDAAADSFSAVVTVSSGPR